MVYTKPDGTNGFSWQKHYDFLLEKHPDNLEEIVHARLEVLAEEEPEEAACYRDLSTQLRKKMDKAVQDDPEFGYVESDNITKQFVKEKNLTHLFDDVPKLSSEIDDLDMSLLDDEVDLSFLNEELEGILFIEPWKS